MPLSPESSIVSPRSKLSRVLLAAGIALAVAGQVILLRLRGEPPPTPGMLQAVGGLLLVLGGLAFGLAVRQRFATDSWPRAAADANRERSEHRSILFSMWQPALMLSVASGITAIAIFVVTGESRIVIGLWLAGMTLLLVAQARGMSRPRTQTARIQWGFTAAVFALLLITVATRLWNLTILPLNFDGDFASVGLEARAIATGRVPNIFTFLWASIPVLGYMPTALSLLLFGDGLLGLNMAGVIEGALIILGVYLLGRELFSARIGLLAAAFLVISYTHMALSRQPAYVDPVLLMTWAVYLLLRGLRAARSWALVLSGFLTAGCIEVYYSGRIILPLIGLALVYALLFQRQWLLARWKGLVIFGLAFLLALGPMLVVFIQNPQATMSRSQEVFILAPEVQKHMRGVYGVDSTAGVLMQQAIRSLFMFHYYKDKGTQFALLRPFLDPFTGVLFALGFGYLLCALRRAGAWLLLCWIVLVVVTGCFLTVNAPFWPRLMVLLPAVALTSALALDVLYELLHSGFRRLGRVALLAPVLTTLVLGAVGLSNWNAYVADKAAFATGRTRIARYLAGQPSSARAYLVSASYNCDDREFAFLNAGQFVGNLTPAQAEQAIAPVGSPTLLFVTPDTGELPQRLAAKYAGGPVGGNSPGEVAFYVFQLP